MHWAVSKKLVDMLPFHVHPDFHHYCLLSWTTSAEKFKQESHGPRKKNQNNENENKKLERKKGLYKAWKNL